jgi:hypothetical protein
MRAKMRKPLKDSGHPSNGIFLDGPEATASGCRRHKRFGYLPIITAERVLLDSKGWDSVIPAEAGIHLAFCMGLDPVPRRTLDSPE